MRLPKLEVKHMPSQSVNEEVRLLNGGLSPDTNPISGGGRSLKDAANIVTASDGAVARRYGLDLETSGVTVLDDTTSQAIGTSIADVVGTSDIFMLSTSGSRCTPTIRTTSNTHIKLLNGTLDSPSTSVITSATIGTLTTRMSRDIQHTTIGTSVIVPVGATSTNNMAVINVDTGDAITTPLAKIAIRDFWGYDDTLDIAERPAVLTGEHSYNLINQGWTEDNIGSFFTVMAVYPSNGDLYYIGRDVTTGVYNAALLEDIPAPSGAPKGAIPMDLRVGVQRGTQYDALRGSLPALPAGSTAEAYDTTIVAAHTHAGRVFFAAGSAGALTPSTGGVSKVPDTSGFIYFSRVVDDKTTISFPDITTAAPTVCMSIISPTDEGSIPLDTDGGFISIAEAGRVSGFLSTNEVLFVFAEHGIWAIQSQDRSFSPISLSVEKISSYTGVTPRSIVRSPSGGYAWSAAGVLHLSYDARAARPVVNNISEGVVNSLYSTLYNNVYASTFDVTTQTVKWLSFTDEGTTTHTVKELTFETANRTFGINVFSDVTGTTSDGELTLTAAGRLPIAYATLAHTFPTPSVAGNAVDRERKVQSVKYLVYDLKATNDRSWYLSDYNNVDFLDYENIPSATGVDAPANLLTQYITLGDSQRRKNYNYVTTHFFRTEDGFTDTGGGNLEADNQSSCLMTGRFDFSNSAAAGKWGTQQQVYRLLRNYIPADASDTFDYGQEIITTKNRVRGSGKSLQLKFESEAGKDFQLIGWGWTGNVATGV